MNKVNNDCSEKGTVIICDTGGSRSRIADESSGESRDGSVAYIIGKDNVYHYVHLHQFYKLYSILRKIRIKDAINIIIAPGINHLSLPD